MKTLHWLLLASVAACSPYQYSTEVKGISTGVDKLADAVTSGFANLAADREAVRQQSLMDKRARIAMVRDCAVPAAAAKHRCMLLTDPETPPAPAPVANEEPRAKDALKVLTGYAHGLAAVTNAADRTAYDDASKRLETSAGKLAKFGEPAAPGIGTVTPVLVNGLTWVLGAALDQDRFNTLSHAVNYAREPVKTAGKALKLGLLAIETDRIQTLHTGVEKLAEPLGRGMAPAVYKERFLQAEAMRARLDALRHANAGGAADALIEAHESLVKAVNDPRAKLDDLMEAIGDFATKASAAQTALAAPPK